MLNCEQLLHCIIGILQKFFELEARSTKDSVTCKNFKGIM